MSARPAEAGTGAFAASRARFDTLLGWLDSPEAA